MGRQWKQYQTIFLGFKITADGPSMDEWIKKMWYIHTVEYYSFIKIRNIIISNNMDRTEELYAE